MDFGKFLSRELAKIEAAGLRRRLRVVAPAAAGEVECDGRRLVNFSSNDYLGLAGHPALREAAARVSASGAGASRLVCGNFEEHERLEEAIARFKRAEAALTFSTGYAAALGGIATLAGEGDAVILDKLSHASLVDGARLSGAALRVFPHNDVEKLASHLSWAREKFPSGRILVVAESVYSMDGDVAPLREIVERKERFGAWLMLDEAHGVGVLGENGRGLADAEGLAPRIEVQMGTLGKALGAAGAYVCGSANLREFLINRARSFIFSTAPPPAVAASARAAIEFLEGAGGAQLVGRLWENLKLFAARRGTPPPASAMEASQRLAGAGLLVPAIRYPTVARGAARLRVTLSAAHTAEQIDRLAAALDALV